MLGYTGSAGAKTASLEQHHGFGCRIKDYVTLNNKWQKANAPGANGRTIGEFMTARKTTSQHGKLFWTLPSNVAARAIFKARDDSNGVESDYEGATTIYEDWYCAFAQTRQEYFVSMCRGDKAAGAKLLDLFSARTTIDANMIKVDKLGSAWMNLLETFTMFYSGLAPDQMVSCKNETLDET